jgi:diguanylate cyclase (GGDEF)-like protein
VLVVEDDDESRDVIGGAVRDLGYRCTTASDGAEARALLERNTFDVVVSDWRMPGLEGTELCRYIRSHDTGEYTYFIMVTGLNDRDHLLAGLSAGANDYLVKPLDFDELTLRLHNAEQVIEAQKKLRRDSEGSFRLARVDALTGVGNRLRMEEDLRALASDIARYGKRCALALCDVDHFKAYNDLHGHLAGDELLRAIARTVGQVLRAGDHVYRYGGEEFLIVFPEQSVAEATAASERVRAAVAERCGATVSAGVAAASGPDAKTWLAAADEALYRAKESGRNRVEAA